MNRETKTITTPLTNKSVVIYSYITGREKRQLTNVYMDGKLGFNIDSHQVDGIKAELMDKAQDLAFKICVVSIDGKKDGEQLGDGSTFSVVDAILNLDAVESDFIIAQINEITTGTLTEKKKTI